jgi:hypothetical protein
MENNLVMLKKEDLNIQMHAEGIQAIASLPLNPIYEATAIDVHIS